MNGAVQTGSGWFDWIKPKPRKVAPKPDSGRKAAAEAAAKQKAQKATEAAAKAAAEAARLDKEAAPLRKAIADALDEVVKNGASDSSIADYLKAVFAAQTAFPGEYALEPSDAYVQILRMQPLFHRLEAKKLIPSLAVPIKVIQKTTVDILKFYNKSPYYVDRHQSPKARGKRSSSGSSNSRGRGSDSRSDYDMRAGRAEFAIPTRQAEFQIRCALNLAVYIFKRNPNAFIEKDSHGVMPLTRLIENVVLYTADPNCRFSEGFLWSDLDNYFADISKKPLDHKFTLFKKPFDLPPSGDRTQNLKDMLEKQFHIKFNQLGPRQYEFAPVVIKPKTSSASYAAKMPALTSDLVVVFSSIRDSEASNLIKESGGEVKAAVNTKTTVLIAKDPDAKTANVLKAKKLGVKIITLEEFNKALAPLLKKKISDAKANWMMLRKN